MDILIQLFISLGGFGAIATWLSKALPKIIMRAHALDEATVVMMRKDIINFYNKHKNAKQITWYEHEWITEMGNLYTKQLSLNGYIKKLLDKISNWEITDEGF